MAVHVAKETILCLLVVGLHICSGATKAVPNKFRYSQHEQDVQSAEQVPIIYQASQSISANRYSISGPPESRDQDEYLLDDEDRSLLSKFYRETRLQDPFQDDSFNSQSLWDDSRDQELKDALSDLDHQARPQELSRRPLPPSQKSDQRPEAVPAQQPKASSGPSDWTFDSQLVEQAQKLSNGGDIERSGSKRDLARYSPDVKLLTLYNPIGNLDAGDGDGTERDKVVGATLFGQSESAKPSVSSRLPAEAIKLHDELLQEPPRDGKVRVRMYFHRAIHDKPHLYGTGPWKYWGHGWGVEFGYNPKLDAPKDFYQKGYTIERAFGRDFCRHPKNCRPPDPKFLQTQQAAWLR